MQAEGPPTVAATPTAQVVTAAAQNAKRQERDIQRFVLERGE